MAACVHAARVGDVPPGPPLTMDLHGQSVVLANVDRAIDALSGMCSHVDGPLGWGKLYGAATKIKQAASSVAATFGAMCGGRVRRTVLPIPTVSQ